MEDAKSFGIILDDCLQIPNCIKMVKQKQWYYIFTWNIGSPVLSICQINYGNELNAATCNINLYKQNFNVSAGILDIICIQTIQFIFLVNGLFYQLEIKSDSSDQENKDNCSSEEKNVFQLTSRGHVKECDTVIAVCPVEDGFSLLGVIGESFFLQTYDLSKAIPRFIIPVQIPLGTSAVLNSCFTSQMELNVRRYLFPDLEALDEEIVLVGLSSGFVGWFLTRNPTKGLQILCRVNQPIKLFHWITDASKGQHTGLLIILSNGLVVAIVGEGDDVKSHTLFLPGDVAAAICVGDKVVTSDGLDCTLNQLCLEDITKVESSTLSVKGVQSMCKAEDADNTVIVGTIHQSVYFINTLVKSVGNPNSFVMPDQCLLDGILYNTQQLDKVNKEMDREDMIMEAVSTTTLVNSLTNLFKITVLVYPGEKLTVTIQMIEDAFVFASELWEVHLQLSSSTNDRQSLITKLRHNLTQQTDLVVDMICQISVQSLLECSLVAMIEDNLPWLVINLGKVDIDACFLLEPINILNSLLSEADITRTEDCHVYIKLPDHIHINSLNELLLKDVQHRISGDMIKMLSDEKRRVIHMKLGNSVVVFSLDEKKNLLVIGCSDVEICHQIKAAVVKRFITKKGKILDANLILEIQALHQILEFQRLKTLQDVKEITSVKNRIRSEISSQFVL